MMFNKLRKATLATLVCGLAFCAGLPSSTAQDQSDISGKSPTKSSASSKAPGSKSTQAKSKPQQESVQVKNAEPTKSNTKPSTAKSASQAKGATGNLRLPRYFSGIIDQEQREQIHSIQLEYRTRIDELEKELALVRQDEMQALEKVLTDSQRKLLEKKRSQAKSKPIESDSAESM